METELISRDDLLKVMSWEEFLQLDSYGAMRTNGRGGINSKQIPTYYRAKLALARLSEQPSASQTDQTAELLYELEQQRRNLLTLIYHALEDCPVYKLQPSEIRAENVGDVYSLAPDEVKFWHFLRVREGHARVATSYIGRAMQRICRLLMKQINRKGYRAWHLPAL